MQSASLYVGDLHPDVTEANLFEIFNAVGPVASIRVCRDAVTRRSLGYAYVNFHNMQDAAERALDTLNYSNIKGRPCRIMWSHRDPTIRKSGVGNVFVKNLDPSIDNKGLYDTFSLFGNILSCKVATSPEGESKGYGFVHYETADAAEQAIRKVNGMEILGKQVYVGHFVRRSERSSNKTSSFTNCFVKNIPLEWTEKDLEPMFEKFGEIVSAVVMKGSDAESEKNKGFGFVNFKDPEAAAAAVEALNETKLGEDEDAKELYVGRAQKKSERDQELRNKWDSVKSERYQKYQGVNLYVKNLSETVDDDRLRKEFSAFGTITSCRVMKGDKQGQSRGFGFVCLSAPEEATRAVTDMNGKMLDGKPIYVALAQRKEVRRAQLEQLQQQRAQSQQMKGMHMAQMPAGPGQPPMGAYGMQPMYFQPNMPPQGRPGAFLYPQQMMPRGMPQQVQGRPGQGFQPQMRGGPGFGQPMPYMGGMPGNQGQRNRNQGGQRNQRQGGGGAGPNQRGQNFAQGRNQQGGQMNQRGGNQNQNFKYTPQVRNQPNPDQQQQPPQAQPVQAAPASGAAGSMQDLTTALAQAAPEQQKNMLGERLYPIIHEQQPQLAGKITGMLLEMDNSELLHLLESPNAMTSKVTEAMQVLQAHSDQQQQVEGGEEQPEQAST